MAVRGLRRVSRLLGRVAVPLLRVLSPSDVVLLRTVGRRTGRVHEVVLPVYLREGGRLHLVSAYGRRSDWHRNVEANPAVDLRLKGERRKGVARTSSWSEFRPLLEDAGEEALPGPAWLAPLTRRFTRWWARRGSVVTVELEPSSSP